MICGVSFSLYVAYDQKNNTTSIQTSNYFISNYEKPIKELQYSGINKNVENLKSIAYKTIVVEKKGKLGVLDFSYKEIAGPKYTSILFDEYTQRFIASDDEGKYGLIALDGSIDVNFKYDSIEILNYSPLLYQVGEEDKYLIMDENGNLLNNVQYDRIGYPQDTSKSINYTLIVPNLNENIKESIVVCKDSKYGLIDSQTGETFIECELDAIYCVTGMNNTTKELEDYYLIQKGESTQLLTKYVDGMNEIRFDM